MRYILYIHSYYFESICHTEEEANELQTYIFILFLICVIFALPLKEIKRQVAYLEPPTIWTGRQKGPSISIDTIAQYHTSENAQSLAVTCADFRPVFKHQIHTCTFCNVWQVTIGFACIGVINGVFMQETLRVAQSDDAIMMRDVARKDRHVQWVPVGNFVVGCAKCDAKLLFVWPAIVIFDLVLFSLFSLIPCIIFTCFCNQSGFGSAISSNLRIG